MINMPYTLHFSRRAMFTVLLPLVALILSLSIVLSGHFNESAHAGAPTCTWTGAGGGTNFSTAGNWTCDTGSVPADGTTLIFPVGLTNRTANNNLLTSVKFSGIQFTGTCTGSSSTYAITGALPLSGNISDLSTGPACLSNTTFGTITLYSNSTVAIRTNMSMNSGVNTGTFNLTISSGASSSFPSVGLNGTITGSGQVIASIGASLYLHSTNTNAASFTGSFTDNSNGVIYVNVVAGTNQLGSSPITVGDTGRLMFEVDAAVSNFTITNPITVSGAAYSAGTYSIEGMGSSRIGVWYYNTEINDVSSLLTGFVNYYHYYDAPGKSLTFSGGLTLQSNLVLYNSEQVSFTGAISGSGYSITRYAATDFYEEAGGPIVVNGSSNNSLTANATYTQALRTTTFAAGTCGGVSTPNAVFIGRLNKVVVDGTCTDVLIRFGGALGGSGTVGNVTVQSSQVTPGDSPGLLNTGNVSFDSGSTLNEQIGGTTAGTGYDQLNVTGTVALGSSILNISTINSFAPIIGNVYTIINNDGSDAVTGTFNGLAQNAKVTVGGYTYKISYIGGTGNDVTLTVTGTPGAPDTSGVLAKPANIAVAGGVIIAGVGLLVLRGRYMRTVRKTVRVRR